MLRESSYSTRRFFVRTGAGEELAAQEFLPSHIAAANWLVLHGAGTASMARAEPLCRGLADHGHGALAFDFSGHGASTGLMSESSLRKRTGEALAMVRYLNPDSPLNICGFSMSGEIAMRLLDQLNGRIASVILFAPAIYAAAAYDLEFGPEFSRVIRRCGSWRDSRVLQLLENYTGRLLITIGERDDVIPDGVITAIREAATNACQVELLRLPGAQHQLGAWMAEHRALAEQLVRHIVSFVESEAH